MMRHCRHLFGAGLGCSAGARTGAIPGEVAGTVNDIRYDSDSSEADPCTGPGDAADGASDPCVIC